MKTYIDKDGGRHITNNSKTIAVFKKLGYKLQEKPKKKEKKEEVV